MKTRFLNSTTLKTALLVVITAALLFPIFIIILTSFKPPDEIFRAIPSLFPEHYTLENYQSLFSLRTFRDYMVNSILVAGLATVVTMMIASLASYALVWMKVPGKRMLARSVLVAYMFPRILLAIPLAIICYETNLIDNRFVLVLIYLSFTLPFSVWFLKSSFEAIPGSFVEASKLDGCNDLQCLWKIVLPVSLPVVTTTAVLSFVIAWNEYLYANTLIINDVHRTVAVGLQTLIGYYHVDYGLLTAAGVIMILPVSILFLLVQRYIVKGLALGNRRE
jgi:multiple sugar transport system permease protein